MGLLTPTVSIPINYVGHLLKPKKGKDVCSSQQMGSLTSILSIPINCATHLLKPKICVDVCLSQ